MAAWGILLLFTVSTGTGFLFVNPIVTSACGVVVATCLCLDSSFRLFRARYFYLAGILVHFIGYYWLPRVLATFGDLSFITSWAIAFVFVAIQSLRFPLYILLNRALQRYLAVSSVVAMPLSWTVVELAFPSFLPWHLGSLLWDVPYLKYAAAVLGVTGVGWLFLCFVHVVLSVFVRSVPSSKTWVLVNTVVIAVFCLWCYQYEQEQLKLIDDAPRLKVGLVQPNLDPIEDFRNEKVSANIAKYRKLTSDLLLREQPDVIVWAESSVGLTYYSNHSQIVRGAKGDPMPGLSIPLLFGGQATAGDVNGKPGYYTSVFAMEPSGRIPAIYHKQELLPISEKPVLGSDMFVLRSFAILPGQNQEPLHWVRDGRKYRAAAIICYEDLWSGVFATLIDHNPDFLLVVTNDSWFLQTLAAKQHAYVARWRSIEFGRSLVRATNDGVSLAVDGLGRSILELEPFVATNGVADIPLAKYKTPFAAYGSVILWALLSFLLVLSLLLRRS